MQKSKALGIHRFSGIHKRNRAGHSLEQVLLHLAVFATPGASIGRARVLFLPYAFPLRKPMGTFSLGFRRGNAMTPPPRRGRGNHEIPGPSCAGRRETAFPRRPAAPPLAPARPPGILHRVSLPPPGSIYGRASSVTECAPFGRLAVWRKACARVCGKLTHLERINSLDRD